MDNNSWLTLKPDQEEFSIDSSIQSQDPFACVDIGWGTQMLPFIEAFTDPGQVVLDPFAGLGTTLMATEKLSRVNVGFEIEPARIKLTKHRWLQAGFSEGRLNLHQGDCVRLLTEFGESKTLPEIDLCLTNIPYFNCSLRDGEGDAQLYGESNYRAYMRYLKQLFFLLSNAIKPGGYFILAAENVRLDDGSLLPIAWDIGKSLGNYFKLYDERIITYEKKCDSIDRNNPVSNRAHEYFFIAQNTPSLLSLPDAQGLIAELDEIGIEFIIYGGLAQVLAGLKSHTKDMDILVPNKQLQKTKLLKWLLLNGYECHNYDGIVDATTQIDSLRFLRCFTDQLNTVKVKRIDIVFVDSGDYAEIPIAQEDSHWCTKNLQIDDNWRVSW